MNEEYYISLAPEKPNQSPLFMIADIYVYRFNLIEKKMKYYCMLEMLHGQTISKELQLIQIDKQQAMLYML